MTSREQNREAVRRYRRRYGKAYTAGYAKARDRAAAEFRRLHPDIWQRLLDEECGDVRAAQVAQRARLGSPHD